MLTELSYIWTRDGWMNCHEIRQALDEGKELQTVSYNWHRRCSEYDKIVDIEIQDYDGPLYICRVVNMSLYATPDHKLMNRRGTTLQKAYLRSTANVVADAMFEPFSFRRKRTKDDVLYSARLAATASNNTECPWEDELLELTTDFCGYEAYLWVHEFLRWTIKREVKKGWVGAVFVSNHFIKERCYDIGHRAGYAVKYARSANMISNPSTNWMIHFSSRGQLRVNYAQHWNLTNWQGQVFKVENSNKSLLLRNDGRIFLASCER